MFPKKNILVANEFLYKMDFLLLLFLYVLFPLALSFDKQIKDAGRFVCVDF